MPSARDARQELVPALYDQCRRRVGAVLAECVSCSVACDVWTASGRPDGVWIGFTCSGVSADWRRSVVFLGLRRVSDDDADDDADGAVSRHLRGILDEWNLPPHRVTLFTSRPMG